MNTEQLQKETDAAVDEALNGIDATATLAELENLRPQLLGKSSRIRGFSKSLGSMSADERPAAGKIINAAAERVEAAFLARLETLRSEALTTRLAAEKVDVTLPSPRGFEGALHPITLARKRILDIFVSMGYDIADGPEVEDEYHNFDALNMPATHPARDMHDTFYLPGGRVLRTHTSPIQIRYMKSHKPPIAVVAPGRVFRVDDVDATHSPVFHQFEALVVDRGVTFGHLKGTINAFLTAIMGEEVETRFRPSFFPFTEPSAEVDVKIQTGSGERWVEIMGCGMVHPNVLREVGIDPEEYSGFAFGMGIDRIAMRLFGLTTIRDIYGNDLRLLRQFASSSR